MIGWLDEGALSAAARLGAMSKVREVTKKARQSVTNADFENMGDR
ncbi:MAG: hypothetical protein AAF289_10780 [Cyanobacteria bacterium P01_A01_bin.135]